MAKGLILTVSLYLATNNNFKLAYTTLFIYVLVDLLTKDKNVK